MTAADLHPLVDRLVDERYRIVAHLADGGMGSVFDALDTRLDRHVALKVMRPELARDAGFVDRFRREARSAARLSHPNVVGVYDQGSDGELVFLAMERVEGPTLRAKLDEVGAFTPREALETWTSVLQALAAAHRAGIIHRDVKPENVLIGADGVVKVADFGLARAVTTQTSTLAGGQLLGTAAYLAPEQIEAPSPEARADARSDVYGAGLLLYEMLTGRRAVEGDSPVQVAYQHVHGTLPAPSATVPTLPAELDALYAWATQKDPARRPEDAGALLAQVKGSWAALDPAALDTRPQVTGGTLGAHATSRLTARTTPVPLTPAVGSGATAALPVTTGRVLLPGEELPDKVRRPGPGPALRWFLGSLMVTALIGLGVSWWFLYGPASARAVPDVVRQNQAQAVTALAGQDLATDIARGFSEDVPRGQIISTDPGAGQKTRRGTAVKLVVSDGKERYAVPAVIGKTRDDAEAELSQTRLATGTVAREFHDTIPAGRVTRTRPEPSSPEKRDTKVDIWLSDGPAPIQVPTVVEKTLQDARSLIEGKRLRVGEITEVYSNLVATGLVISQNPASGNARKDTAINLVVSKGPDLVPIPDVRGMSEAEAVALLREAGLMPRIERLVGGIFGMARGTDPPAGQQIGRGSTVALQIV